MSNSTQSQPPTPSELIVLHGYRRLLRRSPLVFAAAVLGGLLALGAARITPPTYRGTAVLDIGVDYGRSQWLDEDADRLVMGRVQALILSDEVLAEVQERIEKASSGDGAAPSSTSALRDEMRLVWVDNRWELSFASQDPQQAAAIANLWAEVALEHLHAAWERAWRVAELQSLYFDVYCRPEGPAGEPADGLWVCDEGEPGRDTAGLSEELLTEIGQSHGIIPALSFGWKARASAPMEPEIDTQSARILAGMLVGLLVGTLAAVTVGESRQ